MLTIPSTAYYSTMPKPEPFQLFFLSIFLLMHIRKQYRIQTHFIWLGLAMGAKISILPLVLVVFAHGIVIQGKAALYLFNNRRNSWEIIKFLIAGILTQLILIGLLILFAGIDLNEFIVLFKKYLIQSKGISSGFCCNSVSQSLQTVLFNLYSGNTQSGRWFPYSYADIPGTHSFGFGVLKAGLLFSILWFIRIIITLALLYIWRYGSRNDSVAATIAVIPVISPVFWFVHLIYLFVPYAFMITQISLKKKLRIILVGIPGIIFMSTNPMVIGGYLTDLLSIHGIFLWISVLMVITYFFISYKNKEELI
jgi:hypothetical protein